MATHYGEPLSGDRFIDRRRTGVGGSDAGAILGVSPYASKLGVWQDKLGLRPPRVPSERMIWGTRLQDAILTGYGADHDYDVERGRFLRHAGFPWMIGHPDGYSRDARARRRLVEVKTTSRMDEQWGEEGSDEVPAHYFAQVQHYLFLTGIDEGDLTVLALGANPRLATYTIRRDEDFLDSLVEEERAFWSSVRSKTPPEPDGSEDAARALRAMFPVALPEEVVATEVVNGYAERYLEADAALRAAEAEKARWAQAIQGYMGSREKLLGPGYAASWANRKGSPSWKAVAAEALTALQLIASQDQRTDLDLAGVLGVAMEAVEGWDATVERHRSASTRTFTLARKAVSE